MGKRKIVLSAVLPMLFEPVAEVIVVSSVHTIAKPYFCLLREQSIVKGCVVSQFPIVLWNSCNTPTFSASDGAVSIVTG